MCTQRGIFYTHRYTENKVNQMKNDQFMCTKAYIYTPTLTRKKERGRVRGGETERRAEGMEGIAS